MLGLRGKPRNRQHEYAGFWKKCGRNNRPAQRWAPRRLAKMTAGGHDIADRATASPARGATITRFRGAGTKIPAHGRFHFTRTRCRTNRRSGFGAWHEPGPARRGSDSEGRACPFPGLATPTRAILAFRVPDAAGLAAESFEKLSGICRYALRFFRVRQGNPARAASKT